MARQPYSKRYPKIIRAKRITLPLAIAALLVCWLPLWEIQEVSGG